MDAFEKLATGAVIAGTLLVIGGTIAIIVYNEQPEENQKELDQWAESIFNKVYEELNEYQKQKVIQAIKDASKRTEGEPPRLPE